MLPATFKCMQPSANIFRTQQQQQMTAGKSPDRIWARISVIKLTPKEKGGRKRGRPRPTSFTYVSSSVASSLRYFVSCTHSFIPTFPLPSLARRPKSRAAMTMTDDDGNDVVIKESQA